MTAAFLQAELSNLISDAKRKHAEIKTAAEKSLSDLKNISITSETQLSGDLSRRSPFIDPFLLACKSQNAKLASTGTAGLQRCVAATAVPRSRIADVLQAYEEASPLSLDVQLKILQTLPSLLQLYPDDLHGQDALGRALSITSDLSANKLPMVSKTASATFHQLVTAIFARIPTSSRSPTRGNEETSTLARDREDAFAIFIDLCALMVGESTAYARLDGLPPPTVLEILEAVVSSHGSQLLRDANATKSCSRYLLPGICSLVESSSNYGVVVRAIRIAYIFTSSHTSKVTDSLDHFLKIILKFVDRPPPQKWKRLLSLEFFRGICSDFDTLRGVFTVFDLQDGRTHVVSDLMASLVRTASEDPTLIGLGRQTTIPTTKALDSNSEMTGAAEVSLSAITQTNAAATGISLEWSNVNTSCLDTYDRNTAPETPDTYVYALVLACISACVDGLSKFIMPLSMPNRKASKVEEAEGGGENGEEIQRRSSIKDSSFMQKQQQLVNPLSQRNPVKREAVENCAKLIESCWPAILAICSTFLNAALDSYYYHVLIRTVQKLAQVSGVLELDTPRDALLTTLAKVSLPSNVTGLLNSMYGSKTALVNLRELQRKDDDDVIRSPIAGTPRPSIDLTSQSLNVRNLLCLRALLNLGIALGPTLSQAAWLIILQSLQQVEALMSAGPYAKLLQSSTLSGDSAAVGQSNSLAAEVSAVDTARRRMIESTSTYSEDAFGVVCRALLQIVGEILPKLELRNDAEHNSGSTTRPGMGSHKSTRSVSGNWAKVATLEIEVEFVFRILGRMASVNLHRFREEHASEISWNLIVVNLMRLEMNDALLPTLRLQCAKIIDAIAVEASTFRDDADELDGASDSSTIVKYAIPALGQQLEVLRRSKNRDSKGNEIVIKIVYMVLEALHNIVGARGEDLDDGWLGVFKIMHEVVASLKKKGAGENDAALYTQAFKVVQLILSDFLSVLDDPSLRSLLELFEAFASQEVDLNMALTTSALYWNVASMLLTRTQNFTFPAKTGTVDAVDSESHNLWSQIIFGLSELCKDNRSDARNAALRMLSRIVNASIPNLEPIALTSCLNQIWLPLTTYYSQMLQSGEQAWETSVLTILEDLQQISEHHGDLLLRSSGFTNLWRNIIQSFDTLLKVETLALSTAAFQTLASILSYLRLNQSSSDFNSNDEAVQKLWNIWSRNQPAGIQADTPNELLLSAHATLLIEIANWRFDYLCSSDDFADEVSNSIRSSVFAARHDQYTMDVRRLSTAQEKLVQMIETLQKLFTHRKRSLQPTLIELTGDVVKRATVPAQKSSQVPGNLRMPTYIAFATACIEILRRDLAAKAQSENFYELVPVASSLRLCIDLVETKYSNLPDNPERPLWQKSCLLGVECVTKIRIIASANPHEQQISNDELVEQTIALAKAILLTPHLADRDEKKIPSIQQLETDERFDMTQLKALHSAAIEIFCNSDALEKYLMSYILLLFRQSLVAQPWYNDLPMDLETQPLINFTKIRRGSIRFPIVPIRQIIYQEALKSLFDIVDRRHHASNKAIAAISRLAAPYVVLRLAHTLKTFIADQPLRYLEQPKLALQHELYVVISSFLNLRVADEAFEQVAQDLGCGANSDEVGSRDVSQVVRRDGKSHLRVMFPLIQKFEEVWYQIPRLDVLECSWQAGEDGQGVERCLKEWKEQVSEGWGPRF